MIIEFTAGEDISTVNLKEGEKVKIKYGLPEETLSDKEFHFGLESPFAYGFKSSDVKEAVRKIREFGVELYPDTRLQTKFYNALVEVFGKDL